MFSYKETIIKTHKETFDNRRPWISMGKTQKEAVLKLLKLLSRSQTGREIIQLSKKKAKGKNKDFLNIIHAGDISVTDTTLVRRFSRPHPEIFFYESYTNVYINKTLKPLDAMLDLAHELIHYSKRNPFNPYRENFNLDDFVFSMLEGEGGEVEAFLAECKVLNDLVGNIKYLRSNCLNLINKKGKFDRQKGIKIFYQIGVHYKDFLKKLKTHGIMPKVFSHLSDKNSLFISSAYGLPYPLAAYKEYMYIKNRACQNERNRLSLIEEDTMESKSYHRGPTSFEHLCK